MRIDELITKRHQKHYEYDYTVLTTPELNQLIDIFKILEGENAPDLSDKTDEELQEIIDQGPDVHPSWLDYDLDKLSYSDRRNLKRLHRKALVESYIKE